MSEICDTHCHLQHKRLMKRLDEIIDSAHKKGISRIIVPGWDLNSSREAINISEKHESNFAAVGIHPHDADTFHEQEKKEIIKLLENEKVVAVGEIGLDYYRDLSPREKQKEVFRELLDIAETHHLPVIIHTRESIKDALKIVNEFNVKGVFHAFNYDIDTAEKIIDMGFMVGIGGVVTFKNSTISISIKNIPANKILLETDSPYLTPVPHRGKTNKPEYLIHILNRISKIRGKSPGKIARITLQNSEELFGI